MRLLGLPRGRGTPYLEMSLGIPQLSYWRSNVRRDEDPPRILPFSPPASVRTAAITVYTAERVHHLGRPLSLVIFTFIIALSPVTLTFIVAWSLSVNIGMSRRHRS